MLSTAVSLICVAFVTLALYLYWIGTFWKRKGVPSLGNIITGVFQDTFRMKKCIGVCLKDVYDETKHELKFYGSFVLTMPVLVLQDREIIKQVFLKEYASFASHGLYYNAAKDPLSSNLFSLAALDWKFMRTKLTPTFTSGKVKYMFNTVQECVSVFHKAVDRERLNNNNVINIREQLARLGIDIISSVAFGIETNSVENKDAMFRQMGKQHFEAGFISFCRFMIRMNYKLCKFLDVRIARPAVNKFIMEAFTKTVEYREKNNVTRNDFLDLLIRLKNDDTKTGNEFYDKKITTEDIAAQAFIFFVAGFETSSATAGFALFELAKHPEIQQRVQEECDRIMGACEGNVTYEAIQQMEYTERVLEETMRLYPALTYIPRAVTKSCKLPATDVFLEKDTTIWVPLLALHLDEEHFPDPLVFDPDRFTEQNKRNIPPYAYMPFGDGPRHCIGMRFAMVQMKAVLLQLMSRYNVELPDNKRTVEFHPSSFVIQPKRDFFIKVTPRVQ